MKCTARKKESCHQMCKDSNESQTDVLNFAKEEILKCKLSKIVDNCLQAASKYSIGSVIEESLECILVALADYGTLARCNVI